MSIHYSRTEFLNTSEMVELSLHFSTGVIAFYRCDCGWVKLSESKSVSIGGGSFQRKFVSMLANRECLIEVPLRKTMPPGTISRISVPEFEELTSVSLPPFLRIA